MLACGLLAESGCCFVRDFEPPGEPVYAPIWEPRLALHAKAARYEGAFRAHNRTPEGLVDYNRPKGGRGAEEPSYGRHSDGPFHTGISLATFSLKYAATRDREVLGDVAKALEGLEMLERVTGRPGLLARYFSRDPAPFDPHKMHFQDGRRAAPPLDVYVWRGDVSKDQYAGVSYGLGACLAHVDDPGIRRRAAGLARRIVQMLEREGEQIVDVTGVKTKYGDLGAFYGPVRIAMNAAICLGLARAAAEDGKGDEYYRSLLRWGYGDAVASGLFNLTVFTIRNHVNDNMAFLVLYPLIHLEGDEALRRLYRRGLEREWGEVDDELNPFFNVVYAACGGAHDERALEDARTSLQLFPDEKIALPVDYTRRPDLDLGRRFFNSRKCMPRAAKPLSINMRPVGTMLWVTDPDLLYGNDGARDDTWLSPLDYLEVYWMARAHGFIAPAD
jgi:hypothetical protein